MRRRYAFAFLLAAGCGITGRYMPHDIKGDTPLVVENGWGGDMCTVIVAPTSASDETKYNLLYSTMRGVMPLKSGEKATFDIKPGAYSLYIESCQQGFESQTRKVDITGPSYLAIGGHGTAPQGYAVLDVTSGPLTACTIEGSMDDGRPCCSGHHHTEPNFGEVCDKE
jgi:hypothetical protein